MKPQVLDPPAVAEIRQRCTELRERARVQIEKSRHLQERSDLAGRGVRRIWPSAECPTCRSREVTNCDRNARRGWHTCRQCGSYWIAERADM